MLGSGYKVAALQWIKSMGIGIKFCSVCCNVLIRPTQNPYLLSPPVSVTHMHSTVLKSLHNITALIETEIYAHCIAAQTHSHTRILEALILSSDGHHL